MLFWLGLVVVAAEAPKTGPSRWEAAIQKFEASDQKNGYVNGGVLFVGSSSIRMWNLGKSFPDKKYLNRGFGGSQIEDSIHFAKRIIFPHRPRLVVLYAGDNDVAKGKDAETVAGDFAKFVRTIRSELPETRIAFIPIKPSLKRWNLWPEMKKANAMIRDAIERDDNLCYIDIVSPMLGADQRPLPDLFVKDGLHLNEKGYRVWTKAFLDSGCLE